MMGNFSREGTFRSREKFLEAFRARLAQLTNGSLRGVTETWEKAGAADVARLSGFGVKIEFSIGETSWTCAAEIPSWIPYPQDRIEEKFDKEFGPLNQL